MQIRIDGRVGSITHFTRDLLSTIATDFSYQRYRQSWSCGAESTLSGGESDAVGDVVSENQVSSRLGPSLLCSGFSLSVSTYLVSIHPPISVPNFMPTLLLDLDNLRALSVNVIPCRVKRFDFRRYFSPPICSEPTEY
jgi:hypothetical protein